MKKEFIFILIIAGLGLLLGILSLVNLLTRGKVQKILKKKILIGTTLLALTTVFTTGTLVKCEIINPVCLYSTPSEPTQEPGADNATPTPMITPEISPSNEDTPEPVELYAAPL